MDFMDGIRKEFDDPGVVMTIGSIRRALFMFRSPSVVDRQLMENMSQLHKLFDKEPEILYHDDPAKLAEFLAIGWGWISKDVLFVD
jgi:hypothetical protein